MPVLRSYVANLVDLAGIEPACKELPTCGFISLTNPFRPKARRGESNPLHHAGCAHPGPTLFHPRRPSGVAIPWHAHGRFEGFSATHKRAYPWQDSNLQPSGPEPDASAKIGLHGQVGTPSGGLRGSQYTREESNLQQQRPQRCASTVGLRVHVLNPIRTA